MEVTKYDFHELVCSVDGVYMEPENVENGRLEKFFVRGKLIGIYENVIKRVKKEVSWVQVKGCEAMEDKHFKTYKVIK